jgi:hypothetical protein
MLKLEGDIWALTLAKLKIILIGLGARLALIKAS